MTITVPPLERAVPDSGDAEEIKDFLLDGPIEFEGDVKPAYPDGKLRYAVMVGTRAICYYASEADARAHLVRIRDYYRGGGTMTSIMVLSTL